MFYSVCFPPHRNFWENLNENSISKPFVCISQSFWLAAFWWVSLEKYQDYRYFVSEAFLWFVLDMNGSYWLLHWSLTDTVDKDSASFVIPLSQQFMYSSERKNRSSLKFEYPANLRKYILLHWHSICFCKRNFN